MTTIRARIQRRLRDGDLTYASPLTEVPGIGPYLTARLARATGGNATVGSFLAALAPRTTAQVVRVLHRALQNARGNQCVSRRAHVDRDARTYHVGDVNERGYEACVALLDHARPAGVRYGSLPRTLPTRTTAAKDCGCRSDAECETSDRRCVRADGACVPRAANTRGFVGVAPHPNQTVHAPTPAARARVRRSGHTRITRALQRDPDSSRDVRSGHSRSVRYARRGSKMWRRPGSKVRLPVVRR